MTGSSASLSRSKTQFIKFLALCIIVVSVSGTILFRDIKQTQFHGDESGWTYSGYYYTDLVMKGDFDWQRWVCVFCGGFGYLNPHLGKWILGIPLQLEIQKPSSLSDFQNWEKALQEKEKLRADTVKEPPPSILLSARAGSVVFGILCCVILLSIGYYFNNIWIGLISALILSINDVFIISSTRAMPDIHYNFFLISLCLCAFSLLTNRSKKHMILSSVIFGVFSGFAASVKITGILIGTLFFVGLFVYRAFLYGMKKTDFISYLAIFVISSSSVIYILNPVFWPSFQKMNTSKIVEESVYVIANFKGIYRDTKAIIESPSAKNLEEFVEAYGNQYPQMVNLSHVFIFPALFIKWNSVMNDMARTRDTWEENRFTTFHRNLLSTYSSFPFEWIFLGIGIVSICLKLSVSLRNSEPTLWIVPFLYFLVHYLFILALMRVNWDRYYFPTLIASKLIVALGLFEVVKQIVQYVGRSAALSHLVPRTKA